MELINRHTQDLPMVLSVDELADLMGVSRAMVDALIAEGEIRSIRIGNRRKISRTEAMRFCEEGTSDKFRGVNTRYRKAADHV